MTKENLPPSITKSSMGSTDCPVDRMRPGTTGVFVTGPLDIEVTYEFTKPPGKIQPRGPRCREALIERAQNAGISLPNGSCGWCLAQFRRITSPDHE